MDHISENSRLLDPHSKEPGPHSGPVDHTRVRARRRRLTVKHLQSLPSRGERYEVGDRDMPGLQIRIDAKLADGSPGAKSWQWRFSWKGKRQKLGLGIWPDVTQAEAHDRVRAARALLERGIDPRQGGITRERSANLVSNSAGAPIEPHSVEALALDFMRRFIIPHRKRPEPVQRIIDTDILKHWRTRDARTIKPHDVLDLLDRIVDRGSPTMANRTKGIIDQMFRFGIQRRYVEVSPVQLLFPPGGPEKPRDRTLDDAELAALLGCIDAVMIRAPHTAIAIRIALLTACRRSELVLAKWSEIDLDGAAPLWIVPPENSKTGVEYRVPLVPDAVAQFRRLKTRAGRSRYILPAESGEGALEARLITRSVARHLKTLAKHKVEPFTFHDLRRTLRTGLARLKVAPHIAERVLNHAQRGVVAAYDVHAYLEEKREALEKWATHLAGLGATP